MNCFFAGRDKKQSRGISQPSSRGDWKKEPSKINLHNFGRKPVQRGKENTLEPNECGALYIKKKKKIGRKPEEDPPMRALYSVAPLGDCLHKIFGTGRRLRLLGS